MYFIQDYVSVWSELTYSWVNWLLKLGYERPLEMEDIGSLPEAHQAKINHKKFYAAYMQEKVSFKTFLDTTTIIVIFGCKQKR